jgi:CRISPR-associated protein (TIGR02710 family)
MKTPGGTHKLMVCSVGGSPEAIVASITTERPAKVIFVPSPQTRDQIETGEDSIVHRLQRAECPLGPAQYEIKPVTNAEDLEECVRTIRGLEPEIMGWLARGGTGIEYAVAVDITGGTKCMSAALALVARRWPCEFCYVGGQERTKGGVGVVVSGKERFVYHANPWQTLGYQFIEDATLLFNQGNYAAAALLLQEACRRVPEGALKRELGTVKQWVEVYETWDRFDHKAASGKVRSVQKNLNDLRHALPSHAEELEKALSAAGEIVAELQSAEPTDRWVFDLLGNASRRARQGRFDDAVARLYRAIEASAQIRLRDHGFSDTGNVTLESLPEALRSRWRSRAEADSLKLSLQDDYDLLCALGDPLGKRFFDLKLNDKGSSLSMRNQSILAHGFQSVGDGAFQALWQKALRLLEVDDSQIPQFPLLGAVHA